MQYFFDESGNWKEPEKERNVLLIGGVVASGKPVVSDLRHEFDLIKADFSIGPDKFHAADVSGEVRERVWRVIAKMMQAGSLRAVGRIINPQDVMSTLGTPADIYLEMAAELAACLILGDPSPRIEFDQTFYHTYPERVAEEALAGFDRYLSIRANGLSGGIMGQYVLRRENLKNKREILLKNLKKKLSPGRAGSISLELFVNRLEKADDDEALELIKFYDWTEYKLEMTGNTRDRDLYRVRILQNTERLGKSLGLRRCEIDLDVKYVVKSSNSAGVQAADFLCFLYYCHRASPPDGASSAVKTVYGLSHIEDLRSGR